MLLKSALYNYINIIIIIDTLQNIINKLSKLAVVDLLFCNKK